jgi:hypothetical protein
MVGRPVIISNITSSVPQDNTQDDALEFADLTFFRVAVDPAREKTQNKEPPG